MKPMLAIALLSVSLSAAPLAFAPPAFAQDGGPDPGAPTAYAGVSREGFYDVDRRMQAVEAHIRSLGRAGARPRAAMRGIRVFAEQQRARHGGELRDWDREAINLKLDQLVGRYHLA